MKRLAETIKAGSVFVIAAAFCGFAQASIAQIDAAPRVPIETGKPLIQQKDNADALVRAAEADISNGLFDKAFINLNEIIKNYPMTAKVFRKLGKRNFTPSRA